jgi:hypothetical protein
VNALVCSPQVHQEILLHEAWGIRLEPLGFVLYSMTSLRDSPHILLNRKYG